jgi:hypothetical protein
MDQSNVMRALEHNNIHKDYLDKLFQSIVRIPVSDKYYHFLYNNIINSYFINDLKDDEEKKSFAIMLASILEKNPRKIKNFMNSMKFHWEMKSESLNLEIFALVHYLRTYFENIYEIIERDIQQMASFISICKNEQPNNLIEKYFEKKLENLLLEKNSFEYDSKDEMKLVLREVGIEEIGSMDSMRLKFKAVDNFKKYFIEKCDVSIDYSGYFGVLK